VDNVVWIVKQTMNQR